MTIKRGGAVVETVVHPTTKREAKIRLDKNAMWFHVTIGDGEAREYFESKDGGEVRQWALKRLALTTDETKLDWKPVVEVRVGNTDRWSYRGDSPSRRTEEAKIEINRYWVALTSDEREWRVISWEEGDDDSPTAVEPALRYAKSKTFRKGPKAANLSPHEKEFSIPHFEESGKSYLPYDPALWAGLVEMCDTVKRATTAMRAIIGSKRGMATLKAVGEGKQPLQLTSGA